MKSVIRFLVLIVVCSGYAVAQRATVRFEHFTVEEGLSQSTVTSILQDHQGYFWFGTQDGLNRFDGHTNTIFRSRFSDSSSLSDSYVLTICEDREKNLWVGTNSGTVDKFERLTGKFSHYGQSLKEVEHGVFAVNAMTVDSSGALWVGTAGGGVLRWDPRHRNWTAFRHSAATGTLSDDGIWALLTDQSGVVWLGTNNGLDWFDAARDSFVTLRFPDARGDASWNLFNALAVDPSGGIWASSWKHGLAVVDREHQALAFHELPKSGDSPTIEMRFWSLRFDASGDLWIGTRNDGLLRYDGKRLFQNSHEPDDRYSLGCDGVMTLLVDRSGILWVGTFSAGVDKFSTAYRGFRHYHSSIVTTNSIRGNDVWGLLQDRNGDLWVSSMGGGVDKIDLKTRSTVRGGNLPTLGKLGDKTVQTMVEDHLGLLWLGTQSDGLFCVDRARKHVTHYRHRDADSTSLISDVVTTIVEDRKGRIWVGTLRGGLNMFDRVSGKFIHVAGDSAQSGTPIDNDILAVMESSCGALWVGTMGNGLVKLEDGKCTVYNNDPNDHSSVSINRVMSLYEDHTGNIWLGTWGGGLNRFDPSTGKFQRFGEAEGLPNMTVCSILEDDHGNLWMSTNNGISRFNPQTRVFRNFDHTDGLQSDEFNEGSCCKLSTGEIVFGGVNGMTIFFPDSVHENLAPPPVVLTSFSVLGKPSGIQDSLAALPEIRLDNTENNFTFQFAALNFRSPSHNQYAYLLDGYERDWVHPVSGQYATYTNVPPGSYVFRVAACNNDGVWNWNGASIKVVILPPLWRTWWAYTIYTLLVVGVVGAFWRYRWCRQKRIMEEQQQRLVEGENQLATERRISDTLRHAEAEITTSLREKEVLLKEIHHRVKNNMQVISSLLNLQATQIADPQVRELFQESQHRVRSMALIHEKLYRSEELSKINFEAYARELTNQLSRAYMQVPVEFIFDVEPIFLSVEAAIPCGLILNELVTNSLKHAFPQGISRATPPSIVLTMRSCADRKYLLAIRDNGVGIPRDTDYMNPATLGLQLVSSLTEQLDGAVTFENSEGTCVSIVFPPEE